MAGIFTTIGEKLGLSGGRDKIQYLLAGTLVLVIIISLVAAITTFSGGKRGGSDILHFYDIETGEEFTLSAEEMSEQARAERKDNPRIMDPMRMMGGPGMRARNPNNNGKRTGVPMTECPECKKWYAPDYLLSEEPQGMRMGGRSVCTHCGTDLLEYHRAKRRKKKKK